MLFYSPNPGLRVICSVQRQERHPVSGDVIKTVPGITAEFAKFGPAYEYTDPLTGETATGASILGHYFDTDLEAVQNNWDDDTKEMVERHILILCEREPTRCQMIAREVAKAVAPWATYDATPVDQIVALAQATGFVSEALAYERENLDRPLVTDGLQVALAPDTSGESDDEAPPAPKAPQRVADPALRTITV